MYMKKFRNSLSSIKKPSTRITNHISTFCVTLGSHFIGYRRVSLIIDQSEFLVSYLSLHWIISYLYRLTWKNITGLNMNRSFNSVFRRCVTAAMLKGCNILLGIDSIVLKILPFVLVCKYGRWSHGRKHYTNDDLFFPVWMWHQVFIFSLKNRKTKLFTSFFPQKTYFP